MNNAIASTSAAPAAGADPRWNAVLTRDRSADGTFFYSVKTTGVYCRPSCAARRANPKNVQFHDSAAQAELAGFRPCKRCWPKGPKLAEEHAVAVAKACRVIEAAETIPTLDTLAVVKHSPGNLTRSCRPRAPGIHATHEKGVAYNAHSNEHDDDADQHPLQEAEAAVKSL